MGCIYRRGKNYWIKYYRNGKSYAESTQSDKIEVAKRKLKLREGEISQGNLPSVCFDRVKFDDLVKDFISDYHVNKRKSMERAEFSVKHLTEVFGGMKVTEITTTRIKNFSSVVKWRPDKSAPFHAD